MKQTKTKTAEQPAQTIWQMGLLRYWCRSCHQTFSLERVPDAPSIVALLTSGAREVADNKGRVYHLLVTHICNQAQRGVAELVGCTVP